MKKSCIAQKFQKFCGRSYKNQPQKFENLGMIGRLDAGNNVKTSII